MKRNVAAIVLLLFMLAVSSAQAGSSPAVFSLDTLALFDGTDDNPAYVAYQGRVYDVSETWPTGSHQGYPAGIDITEPLPDSVHGIPVLDKLPHVGYLAVNLWTLEELEQFRGGAEHPGYVAVDGIVYDVSVAWPRGSHQGYPAGSDITEPIAGAVHGPDVLEQRAVVGIIVEYVLTADDLQAFNGVDGNPGFVAVNGVIYDVSETWPTGSHQGFSAGTDITDAIAGSAHGFAVLGKLPIVGRLD